ELTLRARSPGQGRGRHGIARRGAGWHRLGGWFGRHRGDVVHQGLTMASWEAVSVPPPEPPALVARTARSARQADWLRWLATLRISQHALGECFGARSCIWL